jgi:hypothetical protein
MQHRARRSASGQRYPARDTLDNRKVSSILPQPRTPSRRSTRYRRGSHFQALGGVAFLAPLSLTLLAVALRQSGPPARGVVDGPAGILGVTVLFVLLINTLLLLTIWLLAGWSAATFTGGKVLYYCRLLAEQTGMAIGPVGIARALDCRWRRPTGWVAISAWALGGFWILLSVLSASFTLL